jgi:DNA-binding NtrC family response regulator
MEGAALMPNSAGALTKSSETSPRQVLLVEDDDVLRRNYEILLSAYQLSVVTCSNKSEALVAFQNSNFDVVILDVTLGRDFEVACTRFG